MSKDEKTSAVNSRSQIKLLNCADNDGIMLLNVSFFIAKANNLKKNSVATMFRPVTEISHEPERDYLYGRLKYEHRREEKIENLQRECQFL